MPPRIAVVLIVAFWLAATGWLAYREWWPWLNSEAPPFTVELADEAAPQHANWSIWRDEKQVGSLTTKMTYQKDDTFELYSSVENLELNMSGLAFGVQIKVPKQTTVQNVTREGRLISMTSNLQLVMLAFGQKIDMKALVAGDVQQSHLHAKCSIEFLGAKSSQDLAPIPLDAGSMLNPLQPLARMRVRPGQRWKITNVDPLGEALKASLLQMVQKIGVADKGGLNVNLSPPKVLLAEVLSEAKNLSYQEQTISCYVIEYRSEDITGSTWVQASDGKVLRQEVSGLGEKMVLLRDN